ncbi:MAG: hypothetical protein JXB17_01475, partial [Bacteroidales bacterium]|nr:hypothetical protein [Bacteroidales bacterium]
MELLIIGFIIEIIARGKGLVLLHWPVNLIAGSCFILLLIIFFIYFKNTKFLKWLSSVPTAISAICLFCFLSLLLGFLPQYPQERLNLISLIGLNHIQRSWPFLISEIYLLIVLGFVILRRLNPFNWKNIGFFINHAGLWITLFSITLGSGDLLRLKLKLIENENPKDMVVDDQLRLYRLPFQVKLIDFDIEEYPPKV